MHSIVLTSKGRLNSLGVAIKQLGRAPGESLPIGQDGGGGAFQINQRGGGGGEAVLTMSMSKAGDINR